MKMTLLKVGIVLLSVIGLSWFGGHWVSAIQFEATRQVDQLWEPSRTVAAPEQSLPPLSPLTPTPRSSFKPTVGIKGAWNIDVVSDFTCPPTKAIIFCGAGRNLSIKQDWAKIFKRGFSAVDWTRMVPDEVNTGMAPKPKGWRSRLLPSQRSLWVTAAYFADPPFELQWARNSELAPQTWYQRPFNDRAYQRSLYHAMASLGGGCEIFGDCPPSGNRSTYGYVFLDIENDGTSFGNRQEQVNLYVYMMRTLKRHVSPTTLIGSIAPVPYLDFGYSRGSAYTKPAEWLWAMPARHTSSSKRRGMPDDLVGLRYADVCDVQMPGTYYYYPDFDYNISHAADADRHWLAGLLSEQEVNAKLSDKKRVSWQWLFNTQSDAFAKSGKSENPVPPAVAEGMAIFYWFTGAYGTILWDDAIDLRPNRDTPQDPSVQGITSDRTYQCYEHYVHGLWRLFKHHSDLFDGQEQYLSEQTECSFDGGKTWQRLNANQLKTQDRPFVRAIVRGNQILVAATKPFASPKQVSTVQVRYLGKGHAFRSQITLKGDEIFLGRATMK